MLFGHACRESTIEGKLFKFHWHRATYRHPLRQTPASLLTPIHSAIARVYIRVDCCTTRTSYTMVCGVQETELASRISFRLCSYLAHHKLPFSGLYAFYDYKINRMNNCHPYNTLENRKHHMAI